MSLTRTELKDIASLLTKKGRKLKHQFLAEGVRLLEEADRHNYRPLVVYWSESMLSERGRALVTRLRGQKIPLQELPARQLAAIADSRSPQGIVGRFSVPGMHLTELLARRTRSVLVCENISDPGNLGTLFRSALAFGFDDVILAGNCAEPWSPKVARASAGALFGLNLAVDSTDQILGAMQQHRFVIVAADIGGSMDLDRLQADLPDAPVAVAIGSEAEGLSDALLHTATLRVRVEHSPKVESLNAAVAGSILMREIYHRNRG
ncbi:MAG: RNA methyltransferase [Candidatus Zixiibacteriota bacterium]